jgi:hypothetical protein
MSSSATDRRSFPPRVAWALPIALLLHQVEEWFAGFPEWTSLVLGEGVEPERFLLINTAGFLLITFWTLAAFRDRRMAWIVASFAALLALNAVLHALATVLLRRYSPGTATGVLLSLPLSVAILRSSADGLPRRHFRGAVVAGVLMHGLATFAALA